MKHPQADPKQSPDTGLSRKDESSRVQHSPGGIKGRWIMNSLSLIVVILAAAMIIFSVGTAKYYHTSMRTNLTNRVVSTANFFNTYMSRTYEQFYTFAERFVDDFSEKEKVEVQILDANGLIFVSTSGLMAGTRPTTGDVTDSIEMRSTAVWSGKDPLSQEQVMSVTSPLFSANGTVIGAVRYVTSLTLIQKQLLQVVAFAAVICLLVLGLVVISNQYFIKSIVDPVLKINVIAKEIAQGRYGMRLYKAYDDEIGELCDTINYMSDEISRAERMKIDFISSVSHELRTPLTAIGGWSETLIAGGMQDQEELLIGLEIIQKEARRLTRMVEELLDFAKIENGRMKLNIEAFDVGQVLYEMSYMYSNLLKNENIKIGISTPEETCYIHGDRYRLQQVFLNIIDNAAKYGKAGGKIDVTLEEEGESAIIRIRDYGVGIPEKELPFVKERFFKGSSSRQRGSGIGLAVSNEIVEMHGGSLQIKSKVEEGTCVIITLPALIQMEKEAALEEHASHADKAGAEEDRDLAAPATYHTVVIHPDEETELP